jgi:hypothetical protein
MMTMQQMELEIKRLRAEMEAMKRPKSVAKIIQQSLGGLQFQVVSGTTLQFRIGSGDWESIAILRQRVDGTDVEHSLDPAGSPTYVAWDDVTDC